MVRPQLHFTSRSGWINDPHGITYRDGEYHVFYQYVPDQTVWGPNCHWGHASGPDLLSLTELPIAIAPGDGDDGIWTGSLVTDGDDGRTVVFYTSTTTPDLGIGRIRQATPKDAGWIGWDKGPFVADAPEGLDIIAYRDPFVRREDDVWRMFVGAALRDGTAMALSYTSPDLDEWTYDGVALQRSTTETRDVWMGALWECPQIFELDGKAVMVSSVWDDDVLHYAGYAIGSYRNGVFHADRWGRLTYGDSYYAPSLFTDADGHPCLLFWMRGIGGAGEEWASAHSVAHRLSIRDDRLVATPHPDVTAHRGAPSPNAAVTGLAADVVWTAETGELTVRSGDAEVVALRRGDGEVTVFVGDTSTTIPVSGGLRILVDGPTLEISSDAGIFGARVQPAGERLSIAAAGSTYVYPLG
ncbi:glycoside hydrolase family 32 protein [Microbacterium sp. NPDC056044]|uniref:glycoside hydrolase family 32 protein n=1 Tax=Microbacterium sp. NPDC056044 TaxID=3345690 RepID=UPI0035D7CE8E